MIHALSVDLEDWYQSTYDPNAELTDRFVCSTRKLLEAFGRANVKATFFVLGMAANKSPRAIREVLEAGHEVQSHGYGHVDTHKLTVEQFRQDLLRAKGLIEDICGTAVFGYRAPFFSIDASTSWALDVLAETGHRYDSSIFPLKMRHYGWDGYRLDPHVVTTGKGNRIVEAPIACSQFLGKRWPCGGGGYFRMWPYWILRHAFRRVDRAGRTGVVYVHPYEYDPEELEQYRGMLTRMQRLRQGLWRSRVPVRLERLIRDFRFAPLCDVLSELIHKLNQNDECQ
jgi:polysaccharide deacetylase family protein (PEP-CTERM system associated)